MEANVIVDLSDIFDAAADAVRDSAKIIGVAKRDGRLDAALVFDATPIRKLFDEASARLDAAYATGAEVDVVGLPDCDDGPAQAFIIEGDIFDKHIPRLDA